MWEAISLLPRLVSPCVLALLYFSFVRQRIGWRWYSFLFAAGILNYISALQGVVLLTSPAFQLFGNLPIVVLIAVILPVVLAMHWRRGNSEAGILLIPVVFFGLFIDTEIVLGSMFQFTASRDFALRGLSLINRFPLGPFHPSLADVGGLMSTASLAIIMVMRAVTMGRRQAKLDVELAAAQQVQQVLLPEQTEAVPGFKVESVYEPAEQVGGDFFLVMPAGDGGLLAVIGDVAGKGLPAAMLVATIVGSIRTAAEDTSAPEVLLRKLNDRLAGRTQGSFATALAAHIARGGWVTLANAGHLAPYVDGREINLPPALPLGILGGAQYEITEFFLAPGSRITFYSDGVIEAQTARGELFGFDRGRELSTQPAQAIAQAAKQFGQQDDITVVTVEFSGAPRTDRLAPLLQSVE
jgi:hypothetical protein